MEVALEPSTEQLEALQKQAEAIAKRRKEAKATRPIVVEFAGSPKSGKSTTIDVVTHFFKRMGFKIWAPSEGASKRTPYHLRRDLVAFNTWTLNYTISELLAAYHNVDRPDLIVLDRGPFDSLAWMSLLRDRGELDNDEYETITHFALHPRWSRLIDRIYLFRCTPKCSLDREGASKLTLRGGTAMNSDMLGALLARYDALKTGLAQYPLRAFDTTSGTTPQSTAYTIALDVCDLMEKAAHGA